MNKSEHTPGPWEVVPPHDGARCLRVFSGNKYIAAVGGSDDREEEVEADARLIAAAPDLPVTLATCASALGEAMRLYRTEHHRVPPEDWVRAHDAALDRLVAAGWRATARGLAKEMLDC